MMVKRAGTLLLVAIVLFLGSAVSISLTLTQQAAYTRGWENATAANAPLPYYLPHPGVNVELTQYDEVELNRQLDDMQALGITWVRQEFPWAAIEPEPGVYQWEQWDSIVQGIAEHDGLQLIAVLAHAPEWARHPSARDQQTAPPENNADFANFARQVAARYGEQIDFYQIWDEPNLASGWGELDPIPADYVSLLEAAYNAIHSVDSRATVITAGLAPTIEQGPRNYSDVLFLRAIYENGGQPYFDAVAGKPYGFDFSPDNREVGETILNFSRLILLREEMVRRGDGEKSLWGSQFGWNALPEDWPGPPSIWGSVSRQQQLTYIQTAYERANKEWPWLGGLILQHWQPAAPQDDPIWGFSLIPQGEQRVNVPANLFGGELTAAPAGRHHPLSPYASYSGSWTFSEIGADFGPADSNEATFSFQGTDSALELRRDNYRAYLFVTVDDHPANALPQDNRGQSYVILTSDDLAPHTDVVPIASGLLFGQHTLHFRTALGQERWALAGYRVATAPDLQVYTQSLVLSLGILLIAAALIALIALRMRQTGMTISSPRILPLFWERVDHTGHMLLALLASVLVMIGMLLTWQTTIPTLLRRDPPGLLVGIATAGLLYLSPSLALTLISALVLWFIIFHRIEIGVLLTIFWAPFFLYPIHLYQFAFSMAEVSIFLTATAWGLQHLIHWGRSYRHSADEQRTSRILRTLKKLTALDWGMLLFLGLALLTISWAAHQVEAWREWRTMILEPVLFYFIARTSLRTPVEIRRLVDTFILSATLAALVGLVMFVSGQGIITAEQNTPRLAGIYGSPNNVGLLMERALPFALAYLLISKARRRRMLAALAGVVLFATALLSQSAGAILLGVPVGIVVVLLLWSRRWGVILIAMTAVTGVIALIPLSRSPRFARLFDLSSGTSFFRLRLWQSTLHMLADYPLTGVGLDQFLYQYRGRYILPEAWQEPSLSHPHNILLDFWTRLGLGGLILLFWLQTTFWKAIWQAYRSLQKRPTMQAVSVGAMGAMAALLAHGLVDNSVFVLDLSYIFALLLALPGLLNEAKVDVKA